MFEIIKTKGKWCLPDKPDKIVNGELTFDQESGIILETYDSFSSDITEEIHYPAKSDVYRTVNPVFAEHFFIKTRLMPAFS